MMLCHACGAVLRHTIRRGAGGREVSCFDCPAGCPPDAPLGNPG